MNLVQSYKLLQFIHNINLKDSKVVSNSAYLDSMVNSGFMIDTRVSNLSKNIQKIVDDNQTFTYDYTQNVYGLIPYFNRLAKDNTYHYLYIAFQSVLLESFSLVYLVENLDMSDIQFTNTDMNRVHNNISSIIDGVYSVNDPDTYEIINLLRELDSNLLYIYSTFGDTDYKISSTYDNESGRVNLIPNSSFSKLDEFYKTDNASVSETAKSITENGINYMVYTDSLVKSRLYRTNPIFVDSETRYTLRANTTTPMTVYGVDISGNKLTKLVDEHGNKLSNGEIVTTTETETGIQTSQGFLIPVNADYVSIEFTLKQPNKVNEDRISQLMLGRGYHIGTYVEGAVK